RRTERQGGNLNQVTLEILLSQQVVGPEDDALRIHEALDVLEKADARLARVVEMRYFGGLTEAEIAQALGISGRTVRREWEKA
ncbi:RNA polymerase subunit sigma-70, partial [Escherichia coli]